MKIFIQLVSPFGYLSLMPRKGLDYMRVPTIVAMQVMFQQLHLSNSTHLLWVWWYQLSHHLSLEFYTDCSQCNNKGAAMKILKPFVFNIFHLYVSVPSLIRLCVAQCALHGPTKFFDLHNNWPIRPEHTLPSRWAL